MFKRGTNSIRRLLAFSVGECSRDVRTVDCRSVSTSYGTNGESFCTWERNWPNSSFQSRIINVFNTSNENFPFIKERHCSNGRLLQTQHRSFSAVHYSKRFLPNGSQIKRDEKVERTKLSTSSRVGDLQPAEVKFLVESLLKTTPSQRHLKQIFNPVYGRFSAKSLTFLLDVIGESKTTWRNKVKWFGEIISWAQLRGIKFNGHHYSSIISTCGNKRDFASAMHFFSAYKSTMEKPAIFAYTAAIGASVRCFEVEIAMSILEEMRKQSDADLKPTTVTYNALISALSSRDLWKKALEVVSLMESDKVPMNYITYSCLVSVYGRARKLDLALDVLPRMRQAGVPPDFITYSALISACERVGQWQRAIQVLEEMESEGCEPNCVTYSSLISACAKAKEMDKAFEIYERMRAQGVPPNTVTFNALISACHRAGHTQRAFQVLEMMESAGCRPSVVTYTSLIRVCEEKHEVQRALDLMQQMRSEGIQPNAFTYTNLVTVCEKAEEWWRASEVLEMMQVDRCKLECIIFTRLINMCGKDNLQLEVAFKVFAFMKSTKVALDAITFNALLRILEKKLYWEDSLTVYEEMTKMKCSPNATTYNFLIRASARLNRWTQVFSFLDKSEKAEFVMIDETYQLLTDFWDKPGCWEDAFEAYKIGAWTDAQ